MDSSALVEDLIADGRRFVARFAADGTPVRAAFWLKLYEAERGYLYLATELTDRDGRQAVVRAMTDSLAKLGESWLCFSDLHPISPTDPIAESVIAFIASRPGRSVFRYTGCSLGRHPIEQVYIYPPRLYEPTDSGMMTVEDVGRELLRLMQRDNGSARPSHVALRDGTSFDGVPLSIQPGQHHSLVAQFVTKGDAAPRAVPFEEIASVS